MNKVKEIYALYRDGDLLPDTHLFAFTDVLTAILTFYLFSVTFASKHIKLYCVGYYSDGCFHSYDNKQFICDFDSGINQVAEIRTANPDKYKDNIVTFDYVKQIMSDVDRAIELRFKNNDDNE